MKKEFKPFHKIEIDENKQDSKILKTLIEDKTIFLKEWERLGEKISYISTLIDQFHKKGELK